MRRDGPPSDDGARFANPFASADRRALDTFLEDGDGYERVDNVEHDGDGPMDVDGEYGEGRTGARTDGGGADKRRSGTSSRTSCRTRAGRVRSSCTSPS